MTSGESRIKQTAVCLIEIERYIMLQLLFAWSELKLVLALTHVAFATTGHHDRSKQRIINFALFSILHVSVFPMYMHHLIGLGVLLKQAINIL